MDRVGKSISVSRAISSGDRSAHAEVIDGLCCCGVDELDDGDCVDAGDAGGVDSFDTVTALLLLLLPLLCCCCCCFFPLLLM